MSSRRSDHPETLTGLIQPLATVSGPLAESAAQVLPAVLERLSDAGAARWIDCCRRLATCGWRSTERAPTPSCG